MEEKVKGIIKDDILEEIINLNFDVAVNNYSTLKENYLQEFQFVGLSLLIEYNLDLSNIYESDKVNNRYFNSYVFYDDSGVRHIINNQVGTDYIKMGTAANQKDLKDLSINFNKRMSGSDTKLLNTHLSNMLKLIDDLNLKVISFSPADDNYKEVRKRLFVSLIKKFEDRIEDIISTEDTFVLKLK